MVLIRERTHMPRALLEKLPKLKLIVQTGRMGNHIDLPACTELGIAVMAGTGSPVAAAELTWALIMAASRRLPQYMANLRHGVWQQSGFKASSMPPNFGLGTVLRGKNLGILGFGNIGQLVAGYGKAFGMQVLIAGSEASQAHAKELGYTTVSRSDLFTQSDFLSLHLRLSEQTLHGVTLQDLTSMKATAVLINAARAELLQPDALITALNRGRPGMAAIDVFESEPVLQGHALLRLENCLCTPHIGYVEQESYEHYFAEAFDHILAFLQNDYKNLVNPEVTNNAYLRSR